MGQWAKGPMLRSGAFVHGMALARLKSRIDALEQRTKQFAITIQHVVRQMSRQSELRVSV
jgi:hypothetical protein